MGAYLRSQKLDFSPGYTKPTLASVSATCEIRVLDFCSSGKTVSSINQLVVAVWTQRKVYKY